MVCLNMGVSLECSKRLTLFAMAQSATCHSVGGTAFVNANHVGTGLNWLVGVVPSVTERAFIHG